MRAEMSEASETLGKRIREAEMQKVPYLLIVGEKEIAANAVAVRQRGKGDIGQMELEKLIIQLKEEILKKTL